MIVFRFNNDVILGIRESNLVDVVSPYEYFVADKDKRFIAIRNIERLNRHYKAFISILEGNTEGVHITFGADAKCFILSTLIDLPAKSRTIDLLRVHQNFIDTHTILPAIYAINMHQIGNDKILTNTLIKW